uniref:ATP synthase complex subunit 8 n=2 Tax=Retropinna semoni TaxID=182228 RepID=A0A342UH16_9TELE|nr:ATPase subunit 8 [Retropinna semoni]AOQ30574.1 ATPase subunit 8 [Retropinna semoni]AOQ30587.1 ATPase subunit 8 [Retropinna semoni]
MPQLNPAPWFAILVFSWVIFLTIIPPKVLGHIFVHEPATVGPEKTDLTSWTWPWL